jgi:GntR family transcriptional regulator
MYVREGARKALVKDERQAFIDEQWPEVVSTIRRLKLDLDELLAQARRQLEDEEKAQ